MNRTRRLMSVASTVAVAALVLTACGTTSEDDTTPKAAAAATSQDCTNDTTATATGPVSLTDGLGRKVELDKPAQRVAVLEWQQTEDLLT